jgi:hypothetical protein
MGCTGSGRSALLIMELVTGDFGPPSWYPVTNQNPAS